MVPRKNTKKLTSLHRKFKFSRFTIFQIHELRMEKERTSVGVALRIRPMAKETEEGCKSVFNCNPELKTIHCPMNDNRFTFDYVFGRVLNKKLDINFYIPKLLFYSKALTISVLNRYFDHRSSFHRNCFLQVGNLPQRFQT